MSLTELEQKMLTQIRRDLFAAKRGDEAQGIVVEWRIEAVVKNAKGEEITPVVKIHPGCLRD